MRAQWRKKVLNSLPNWTSSQCKSETLKAPPLTSTRWTRPTRWWIAMWGRATPLLRSRAWGSRWQPEWTEALRIKLKSSTPPPRTRCTKTSMFWAQCSSPQVLRKLTWAWPTKLTTLPSLSKSSVPTRGAKGSSTSLTLTSRAFRAVRTLLIWGRIWRFKRCLEMKFPEPANPVEWAPQPGERDFRLAKAQRSGLRARIEKLQKFLRTKMLSKTPRNPWMATEKRPPSEILGMSH